MGFKELLDVKLRENIASEVNKAILESRGERSEAKIRQLVRARAWAETEARQLKLICRHAYPLVLRPKKVRITAVCQAMATQWCHDLPWDYELVRLMTLVMI